MMQLQLTKEGNKMIRNITATIMAPIIALAGFRFSKHYRHGTTRANRTIYALVNTIQANHLADRIRPAPVELIDWND